MAMKEVEKAIIKKGPSGKENDPGTENVKKKIKEEKPATKVVVRRLPPTMTEDQFKLQVSPLPEIDYFYFVAPDMTLAPNAFSRAYLNFVDQNDLFIFTEKFDGYVFIDSKGGEYPAIVEFAPFQRIPKNRPNRKKDSKMGTIESDPIYNAFKERLEVENLEKKATANTSKQHFFETSLDTEKKEMNNTPLLDYIKTKRVERQRLRDEKREEKRKKDLDRRKAKEELRQKTKKDEDTTVVKVLNNQNSNKDRLKDKDTKFKKSEEVRSSYKEKSTDSRSKETKPRAGKSYLEERQRQAERREEQKKKLSHSQSASSVPETKSLPTPEDNGNQENKTSKEKPTSENKLKNSDSKQLDRSYKRDETRRSSYKYESKRDKDNDESRRARRVNEKGYNKRDEERYEEGGRKRYSESRKFNDSSQREKYRDKEKSKVYTQKKSISQGKSKTVSDKPVKLKEIEQSKSSAEALKRELVEDTETKTNSYQVEQDFKSDCKIIPTFEVNENISISRRNSLDSDNLKFPKSHSRNKIFDKKRRNSFGSTKHEDSCSGKQFDVPIEQIDYNKTFSGDSITVEAVEEPENDKTKSESYEKVMPKRRNSTGETQGPGKASPRRNSLGSEDSNMCHYTQLNFNCNSEIKTNEIKQEQSGRDPRRQRRIRNKDRPTMEIYRPGMGRFSKQRLEREKVLGSSTEVDSPSPSPSPTPTLKPKAH